MSIGIKQPWEVVLAADNGFVQVSAGAAPVGLGTIPLSATGATIQIEADPADIGGGRIARYRMDGGNPSSTAGFLAGDGTQINLINQSQLDNFKIISLTGNAQIVNVQFFYNTLST